MAGSVNKAILIGNVGKDPEVRSFDNGGKVANFSLATSESWKDKQGERQERTTWHNISVFGPLADVVDRYVKKGSKLYLEGKISNREYEKDGQKRYITEIQLQGPGAVMNMLDSKGDSNGSRDNGGQRQQDSRSSGSQQSSQGSGSFDDALDDDVPF